MFSRQRLVSHLFINIFYFFLLLPSICHAGLSYDDVILHYHGEDTMAYAGTYLGSLGDINGDGFDDIFLRISAPHVGCWLFYGGNPVDTIADVWLPKIWQLKPVDVTGDGIDDLVGSHQANGRSPWLGKIYYFKGYGDSIGTVPFDSIYPEPEVWNGIEFNDGFGYNFDVAYVDDDNLGDLVTFKIERATDIILGPVLQYFSGAPTIDTIADWVYESPHPFFAMWDCGFIDYNGDGQLDIFAGMRSRRQDTASYVYIFKGPDFGDSPDYIIEQPEDIIHNQPRDFAKQVTNVGDLNSDGFDDLGVINYRYPIVYFCGPNADTLYDLAVYESGHRMSAAGDVNGDGHADLLIGDGQTAYGICAVYLGGPRLDDAIDDDLVRGHLPPLFIDRIGSSLARAGDFNGDGIDDFMFKSMNFSSGEPNDVWVVKGSQNILVPVEEEQLTEFPTTSQLKQNYPNPFNPSATIEFELAIGQTVKLEVFNVLGQRIETLADHFLSAGSHKIEWDGKSQASGIYLYRLKMESNSLTRKMVLLK